VYVSCCLHQNLPSPFLSFPTTKFEKSCQETLSPNLVKSVLTGMKQRKYEITLFLQLFDFDKFILNIGLFKSCYTNARHTSCRTFQSKRPSLDLKYFSSHPLWKKVTIFLNRSKSCFCYQTWQLEWQRVRRFIQTIDSKPPRCSTTGLTIPLRSRRGCRPGRTWQRALEEDRLDRKWLIDR